MQLLYMYIILRTDLKSLAHFKAVQTDLKPSGPFSHSVHSVQLIFPLGKVTALGVLFYFALLFV